MKSLVIVLGWILGTSFAVAEEGISPTDAPDITELVLEAPQPEVDSPEAESEDLVPVLAEADEPLGEASIPVFQKRAENPAQSIGGREATFVTLAVGIILMIGGFVLMRRWVRKKVGKGSPLQIKIIGQHYLGPKKSLAVVRVAGESILIGITDHNISCIKALSLLDEELPAPDEKLQFSESLMKETESEFVEDEGENFSVTALTEIKDRVSTRLRDLKELN